MIIFILLVVLKEQTLKAKTVANNDRHASRLLLDIERSLDEEIKRINEDTKHADTVRGKK